MNRIVMKNNSIVKKELDEKIELKELNNIISTFKIVFKASTELEIIFDSSEESKLNFEYEVEKDANVNLYEIRTGFKTKVQYKYNLNTDSKLYLYRLNKSDNMREVDLINLNGESAGVEFNLRSLSTSQEKYDIYISHNNQNTTSVVNNLGIALKGGITFNVTGEVPKGSKGSYLDQNNQIVTFDSTKSQINPNLLIDEFDIEANHNAVIGFIDEPVIFYLMSRGISESESIKLVALGLILNNLKESYSKEKIVDFIKEYWG